MFKSSAISLLLLITHILGSLTVGIVFRFWKSSKKHFNRNSSDFMYSSAKSKVNLSNLGGILGESISNSISTLLTIGRFCCTVFSYNFDYRKYSFYELV